MPHQSLTGNERRRRGLSWTAALLLAMVPHLARAADTAASAASQQLFEEGRTLAEGGQAGEACPKFEESYRLDARSGTKFNLADCYERVGRIASAWTLFVEVAAESKAAGRLDREEVARARAAALVPRLSRLVIVVPAAHRSRGLSVERTGVSVGEAQWGSAVPVDLGEHVVRATAPGARAWESRVRVEREGTTVSVIVPMLVLLAGSTPGPDRSAGGHAPVRPQRIAAYAAAGVGAAALGIGSYFGVRAITKLDEADRTCDGNRCRTTAGRRAYDDARSAGNAATVAYAVAGVTLGAAAVLYFTEPGAKPGNGDAASLSVGVGLGSLHAGATW